MKTSYFSININAPRSVVWQTLWEDKTYREWTRPFSEGSYAESDWNEGSEIRFLTPAGEGMYGRIAIKTEPSLMVFEHIGEIKNGKKLPAGTWEGAKEIYNLGEEAGITKLDIALDSTEEFMDFLMDAWPKSLEKLKHLAESVALSI